MTRVMIALTRHGHSDFDALPLCQLAEAVIDGVTGGINARTERLEAGTVFVSFGWNSTSPPVIDEDSLNRFGLRRIDMDAAP